jgi:hypothetical protein
MGTVRRAAAAIAWSWLCLAMSPELRAQERLIAIPPANATWNVGFTQVTSVRELSDGSVIVSDAGENRLYRVDWQSGGAAVVGGIGEGPGEYRSAGWSYALAGDTTLFTDPIGRRWHLVAGHRIVRTIPSSHPPIQLLGAWLDGADRNGRVLGTVPIGDMLTGMREEADSLWLLLIEDAFNGEPRIDTIGTLKGRAQCGLFTGARGGTAGPPCERRAYQTEDVALLFNDGWVAVATWNPYRVTWRAPDGRWIRGAALDVRRISVDDREKCLMDRGLDPGNPRECDRARIARTTWPDALPPILYSRALGRMIGAGSATLQAAPDGNVVIRRTPSATVPGTRYDIIDRSGSYAGRIVLPANEAIVGFGAASVYTIRTDDVDLQWLGRHDWR